MNMKKADYTFEETTDASMKLRKFEWILDSKNDIVLSWEWPQNRLIKLMFVFAWTDENAELPEISELFTGEYSHELITRELSSKMTKSFTGKVKFVALPAYFNDNKGITICKTSYITDWIFKKIVLSSSVASHPVPLGQFQKINLRVTASDSSQMPLVQDILKYAICENGRVIGTYPLDSISMSGACGFYIKKEQTVKFILDENYSKLFDLRSC